MHGGSSSRWIPSRPRREGTAECRTIGLDHRHCHRKAWNSRGPVGGRLECAAGT